MKPKKNLQLLLSATAILHFASHSAYAQNHYWDSNGDTAGFGSTTGTWGTDAFWTTVAGGGATHTGITDLTTADIANFGTTLNYANATVGVAAGGVTATSIVFGSGQTTALTIGTTGGGAITLGGDTRTIVMNTSSTNTASHRIDAPIILTGNTAIQVGAIGATQTRTLVLGGQISGTGVVTFSHTGGNNGTGVIALNSANTYSGNTTISTTLTNANTQVRLGVENALPTDTILTFAGANGTGSAPGRRTDLNLNGNNQTLAGLTNTGGGDLRTYNVYSTNAATLTINDTGNRTFSGLIGNGGTNITLVKEGAGTWTLSGANTYTGTTTINGGAITVSSATALGSIDGDTVVNGTNTANAANARLQLSGGVTVTGEAITISGVGNFTGALTSISGNNVWDGNVTIAAAGTRIGASAGTSLEVSGVIDSGTDAHGLIIRTANTTNSTVILSGANTYLGNTQVLIGKLQLDGGDNRLPVGTILQFNSNTANGGAVLDLNGRNQEVAGIALTGTADVDLNGVDNSSLTLSTLTVNAATASNFDGFLNGNLALTKDGGNTLTLGGTNTYTGLTTINDGTLALGATGTIDDSSGVHLGGGTFDLSAKSGYTVSNLTGTGNVLGAITVSTALAIGNSPGEISFGGDLTLGATSAFNYEFTGGGTAADLGIVSGNLALTTGATLNLFQLGNYTLNDTFTLFAYDGSISGTFAGLAERATAIDDEGGVWRINYNETTAGANFGGDPAGLSFVNITAIPEPSAALLGGLGALLLLRRRRD